MFMTWPSSTFLSFIDWYASRAHIHNARTFTCKTPSRQVKTKTVLHPTANTFMLIYFILQLLMQSVSSNTSIWLGGWTDLPSAILHWYMFKKFTARIIYKCPHQTIGTQKNVPVWSSYIQHVLPATGFATQQWLWMSQASIVDANIHTFVLCLDGSKHGQNLLLAAQVTFEGHQNATVPFTLTISGQFLKWNEIRHICLVIDLDWHVI